MLPENLTHLPDTQRLYQLRRIVGLPPQFPHFLLPTGVHVRTKLVKRARHSLRTSVQASFAELGYRHGDVTQSSTVRPITTV